MENSMDLHPSLQEQNNYLQPERKLQVLGRKRSGTETWTELKSFRGKCKVFIYTIEQICSNAEVGDEKCCFILENTYTWIWFEYFCMLKCSMPNALFTVSKVITFKGIEYIPISNCSMQYKNKTYFEYCNKMPFLFRTSIWNDRKSRWCCHHLPV